MVVTVMMSMVVAMMVVRGVGGRARRRRLGMRMAMVVMRTGVIVVVRAHQSRRNPGSHAENMDDGAAPIVL
jgi:hypothetical protein